MRIDSTANVRKKHFDGISCLDMLDGMSAVEAAEKYNAIQKEQIEAYEAEKAAV